MTPDHDGPPDAAGDPLAETWPDGQPVTPWADPWHDVLGDIRQAKADAEAEADRERIESLGDE